MSKWLPLHLIGAVAAVGDTSEEEDICSLPQVMALAWQRASSNLRQLFCQRRLGHQAKQPNMGVRIWPWRPPLVPSPAWAYSSPLPAQFCPPHILNKYTACSSKT